MMCAITVKVIANNKLRLLLYNTNSKAAEMKKNIWRKPNNLQLISKVRSRYDSSHHWNGFSEWNSESRGWATCNKKIEINYWWRDTEFKRHTRKWYTFTSFVNLYQINFGMKMSRSNEDLKKCSR